MRPVGATQTLTVGTNIPFTTLDPNTINTSVFPFRNSVFDSLIDILVTDIPTYRLGPIQNELATGYTVNKDYTEIRMRSSRRRDLPRRHARCRCTTSVASLRYAIDPKPPAAPWPAASRGHFDQRRGAGQRGR